MAEIPRAKKHAGRMDAVLGLVGDGIASWLAMGVVVVVIAAWRWKVG